MYRAVIYDVKEGGGSMASVRRGRCTHAKMWITARFEEPRHGYRNGFPHCGINSACRKVICLCASNNPSQPRLLTLAIYSAPSPPPTQKLGELYGRGPHCLLTNTTFSRLGPPLMNYSSTSRSSFEGTDKKKKKGKKSQLLKWISRLTCLHKAGLSPLLPTSLYSATRLPSPSPALWLAISAWQKLSEWPWVWQTCGSVTQGPDSDGSPCASGTVISRAGVMAGEGTSALLWTPGNRRT